MPPRRISISHKKLMENTHGFAVVARHSIPTKDRKQLTPEEATHAHWAGRNLPSDFKLSILSSRFSRSQNTGHIAKAGYSGKEMPNQKTKEIYKPNKALGEVDARKSLEELRPMGIQIIRDLNKEVYSQITRSRKPMVLSVSHEGAEYAVLSALGIIKEKEDLEKIFGARKPTKTLTEASVTLAPTEGILFYFLEDRGQRKVILSFRKKRFDITKEIKKLSQ